VGWNKERTSTTLVIKASWISVRRWYYAGPRLDRARDASLDTKENHSTPPKTRWNKPKINMKNSPLFFSFESFLFSFFSFFSFFFFFWATSKTDYMNKRIQKSNLLHTLFSLFSLSLSLSLSRVRLNKYGVIFLFGSQKDSHCRRKLVGSLPWGIPMVVVYR